MRKTDELRLAALKASAWASLSLVGQLWRDYFYRLACEDIECHHGEERPCIPIPEEVLQRIEAGEATGEDFER